MYFIGEITMYGRGTEIDLEKSQECFQKSLQMFEQAEPYIKGSETNSFDLKSYVQYRIGKQYKRGWGTEKMFKRQSSGLKIQTQIMQDMH